MKDGAEVAEKQLLHRGGLKNSAKEIFFEAGEERGIVL